MASGAKTSCWPSSEMAGAGLAPKRSPVARTAGVPGGRWSTVTRDGGICLSAPSSAAVAAAPRGPTTAMSRRQRVDVWVATAPRHSPSLLAVGWSTTIKSATSGPGTLAVSRPARRSSCRLRTQRAVAGEVGGCVGAGIGQVPRRPQHPATAVARCDGAPTRRRLTGQRPRWRPVRPGSGRRRSFHDENLDGPPIPTRSQRGRGPVAGLAAPTSGTTAGHVGARAAQPATMPRWRRSRNGS